MRRWGLVMVAAAALALPAAAAAAPAACSTPPADYSGTDATVAAITKLTQDQDANCQAVTDRLDQVASGVSTAADTAHGDSAAVKGAVDGVKGSTDQLHTDLGNPLSVTFPGGSSGQAVQITNWPATQPVALDSTSSAQIDGEARAVHGDLWLILGAALAALVFGLPFLRLVTPWWRG